MTIKAEVYENAVPTLRQWLVQAPNNTIEVEVDPRVLGGGAEAWPLRGTLSEGGLSPIIAQNTVFAIGPREDSDRRVLEADVQLKADSSKAVANLIGLQVRVRFLAPQ
jgi:HlyD family secretion protein